MLTILRGSVPLINVIPDVMDYQHKQRNGIDYLVLNFPRISGTATTLAFGDTVEVFGKTYYLNSLPQLTRVGNRRVNFSCVFEAEHYSLSRVRYMYLDIANNLRERSFSLMGDLSVFAGLVVLNLNRDYPGIWKLGTIEVTETKNLPFSSVNCLEVLNTLKDEFSVELWFDGNVINLATRNIDSGLSFSYGIRKGLTSIQRNNRADDNDMPITRLYVYGGSRNLPDGYRNYANTLQLDGPIELTPNPNNYPLNEADIEFPDVFPQYVGTVSSIDDYLNFYCALIPFNINDYLIAGLVAKVTFQTGQLAGYELELSAYNNTTKKFTINVLKTETALEIPSANVFADVGDLFIVTDIQIPTEFVTESEARLLQFGQDHLDLNSFQKSSYTVSPDQKYFKDNDILLSEGSQVHLIDEGLNVDRLINLESFKRYLKAPWAYELELADKPIVSLATRLLRQQIKQAADIKPVPAIRSPKVYTVTKTQNFTRNNCVGTTGTVVEFSKKYISNVSLADANTQQTADESNFATAGQANANEKGSCYVVKPLITISLIDVTKTNKKASFTVEASQAVGSLITVKVSVSGNSSGNYQTGTADIDTGTTEGSGVTTLTSGDFTPEDTLTGAVVEVTPTEDANYRYTF
ncbi:hypothetical protein ACVWYG_002595 [Pedobacter sp. UYEF25]